MPSASRFVGRALRLIVLGALLWSAGAHAQGVEALPVGARISVAMLDSACVPRFWRQCLLSAGLSGTLVRATADTLTVRLSQTEVAFPRRAEQRVFVEMSGSRVWSALSIGALAGMASGLFTSQTDASRRSRYQVTATAAAAGLVVGAIRPSTRWRRVAP